MFAEPNVNDHMNQVRYRIQDGRERLQRAISDIETQFMQHGAHGGSRMYVTFGNAVTAEFDTTVREVLGELRRSVDVIKNEDPKQLRDLTVMELEGYVREMRSRAEAFCRRPRLGSAAQEQARQLAVPAAEELGVRLSQMLRQFDVGFLEKAKPEAVSVTNNNLTVGTNIGGAIQQGSYGSSQSLNLSLDVGSIIVALAGFEKQFGGAQLPPEVRKVIEAEVATARAQLQKPSPNPSILAEVGKSIRSIVEGVAAGMMTPQAIAAATALSAALGAG